jgi:hypothetical protein
VLMHWPDVLLMVGPDGNWLKYSCEGVVCLAPEIDGTRIISAGQCEFMVFLNRIMFSKKSQNKTNPSSNLDQRVPALFSMTHTISLSIRIQGLMKVFEASRVNWPFRLIHVYKQLETNLTRESKRLC